VRPAGCVRKHMSSPGRQDVEGSGCCYLPFGPSVALSDAGYVIQVPSYVCSPFQFRSLFFRDVAVRKSRNWIDRCLFLKSDNGCKMLALLCHSSSRFVTKPKLPFCASDGWSFLTFFLSSAFP